MGSAFILISDTLAREKLLRQIGFVSKETILDVFEELPLKNERPSEYVKRVALARSQYFIKEHPLSCQETIVFSVKTVVACGRRILGKAKTLEEAKLFLTLLSGRRHRVYTCVCVMDADTLRHRVVCSVVKFKRLHGLELERYLQSHQWKDQNAGYGFHGMAGAFIDFLSGSACNAEGLPLYETSHLLQSFGVQPVWD